MSSVELLLEQWGFPKNVLDVFKENDVDLQALQLLDDVQINMLILVIRPQANFKKALSNWKVSPEKSREILQREEVIDEIISKYGDAMEGLSSSLTSPTYEQSARSPQHNVFPHHQAPHHDQCLRAPATVADTYYLLLTPTQYLIFWNSTGMVMREANNTRLCWVCVHSRGNICCIVPSDTLTAEAMGGNMTFQEALKKRLDIIRPTVSQIREFINTFPVHLTPGISQLVRVLHERSIPVYLVSGGFRSLIEPVAEKLGIPVGNVHANRLKFYFNGDYAGFDENEPTSRSGGKGLVISRLKQQRGYQRLVMIGDGATDAEACPPADGFIGFGGNVVREEVKKKASWYVTDFQELIGALNVQTK